MIYEAEICNELNKRTAGYNKPIIQLTEPKVYTSPISGDLIRIEAPDNLLRLGPIVLVLVEVEENFSDKFKCKLLGPNGSIKTGWIFKKI